MKKYTKPMVEVVELSVKESLSALPNKFTTARNGFNFTMGKVGGKKNVSVYTAQNSTVGL